MECFKVAEANMVVYIPPIQTRAISETIASEMSTLLFKFSESFDGVLLAYEVSDSVSKRAKILSGLHPYVGVRFRANLLLFNPKPNMYLEGEVVKVAKESIHVVVLGFAAAVINEEDIRDDFKYRVRHDEEIFRSRSNTRHVIKAGTTIRFLVKSFDNEVLYISGSLAPIGTGCIKYLDRSLDDSFTTSRSSKKRREGSQVISESGELVTDGADGLSSLAHSNQSKNAKRKKSRGVS